MSGLAGVDTLLCDFSRALASTWRWLCDSRAFPHSSVIIESIFLDFLFGPFHLQNFPRAKLIQGSTEGEFGQMVGCW